MKKVFLGVGLALLACTLAWAKPDAESDQAARIDLPHEVKDPAYGQVLYHFYQQQYFAAMSRIEVALERNELPSQQRRARVLLGSLYASYGMTTEARGLFEELIEETVSAELATRIWLHLAEIEYRSGRYAQALELLDSHVTDVPGDVADNYRALRTRVLMKLGRYDETATLLEQLSSDRPLSGYLRYNLAVSRINAGQGEEGTSLLWQLVNMPPGSDEINALKDKAMLALGVHYLRTGQVEPAHALMQSARLDGPYSELALLLHARAWLASDQPARALPSLKELTGRSLQLQETQEALLALPFLYDRLGDYARARQAYRDAIERFTGHFAYLNGLESSISEGQWFEQVAPPVAWSTAMDPLPPFEPVRVDSFPTFRQLFASHEFQHYWQAWHEQKRQVNLLTSWRQKLPALNELLAAHVRKHREAVPMARKLLEQIREQKLGARLAGIEQHFANARDRHDMAAFASERELVWLDAMDVAQDKAERWQDKLDPATGGKVDFYRRVLQWELSKNEVPRVWERSKQLDQLAGLYQRHRDLVARVEKSASGLSEAVYARGNQLAGLNTSLYGLVSEGEALLKAVQGRLEAQALGEIRATRMRLRYYIAECWSAMAELEHRAVNVKRRYPEPDQPDGTRSEE